MHNCPIRECGKNVPDHHLMCRNHWFTVPQTLRDQVWATYRNAPHSPEHVDAMRAAIDAVHMKIDIAEARSKRSNGSTA